jgi:hypothetical protein
MMVSIAVLLSLIAIVYPVMATARKATQVQQCIFNLREIGTASHFYVKDNDPTGRGSVPTQPWHLGFDFRCGQPPSYPYSYATEYVYGGFRTSLDHPYFPSSDVYSIPTECRPYNKYIAPGLAGRFPIKNWICPADDSLAWPLIGAPGGLPAVESSLSSWEVNGNSYAINWYWGTGSPMPDWDLPCMSRYGSAMLAAKSGASASEFVLFMEGMMSAYMMDAHPPDGSQGQSELQTLGMGWHGKRSYYSVAYYDGHAEYRFFDTRYTSGAGWDIWPEPTTQWPSGCP